MNTHTAIAGIELASGGTVRAVQQMSQHDIYCWCRQNLPAYKIQYNLPFKENVIEMNCCPSSFKEANRHATVKSERRDVFEGLFPDSHSFLVVSSCECCCRWLTASRAQRSADMKTLLLKEIQIKTEALAKLNCRFMFTVMDYLTVWKPFFILSSKEKGDHEGRKSEPWHLELYAANRDNVKDKWRKRMNTDSDGLTLTDGVVLQSQAHQNLIDLDLAYLTLLAFI